MSYIEVFPNNRKLSLQGHRPRVISDNDFKYPKFVKTRLELLNCIHYKLARTKLTSKAYRVAIYLYQRMNNKRPFKVYPSRGTSADEIGISPATFDRAVIELFNEGILYNQRSLKGGVTFYFFPVTEELFNKANWREDTPHQHDDDTPHQHSDDTYDNKQSKTDDTPTQHTDDNPTQHDDDTSPQHDDDLTSSLNSSTNEVHITGTAIDDLDHQNTQPSDEVEYSDEEIEENKRKIKEATNGAVKNSNPEYVKEKEKNQSFGFKQFRKFWLKQEEQLSNDGVTEWLRKRDTLTDIQVEAVGLAWYETNDLKETAKVFEGLAR